MKKKGLSTVVTTLILILLVLVAIGIVWVVIANLIEEGADDIDISGFTLDLKIKDVYDMDEDLGSVSTSIKRNAGSGDLNGIRFIFNDGNRSEFKEEFDIGLQELGQKNFPFTLNNINVSKLQTLSIAPIFITKSGKKKVGSIIHTYTIRRTTSGEVEPPCEPDYNVCEDAGWECSTRPTGCTGIYDICGSCFDRYGSDYDCNTGTGQCYYNPTGTDCQFTSAFWGQTSVDDGTTVTLNLTGNDCAGKAVTFDIYEDDTIDRDFMISIAGDYDSTNTWTAIWTFTEDQYYAGAPERDDDDGDNYNPRTYYFEAIVSGEDSRTSNFMDVLYAAGLCEDSGQECDPGYSCSESFIPATNNNECCPTSLGATCDLANCNQCTDCDDWFGGCTYEECKGACEDNQVGDCYYDSTGVLGIGENCVPLDCSSLQTCEDYSVEECDNDPCGRGNCTVSGGACTTISGPPPCALSSVSWNQSSAIEGTTITMNVAGTNCAGEPLTFLIREDDGAIGDDDITTISGTFGGTNQWTTTFQAGDTDDPQNEYYVVVTADNTGSSVDNQANRLTVSQLISSCDLTSAVWNPTAATEGDIISLDLQGTNCDGKTISFEVWEQESGTDDPASINPADITFLGSSSSGTWTAEWIDDGFWQGDPEYYFIASVVGESETITSSAPLLAVAQAAQPCELTSASWSQSLVLEGELVEMNVAGTNCAGEPLTFLIREDDGAIGDDDITTISGTFGGTNQWTTTFQAGDTDDPQNEYYVVVTADNTGSSVDNQANRLTVTQALQDCNTAGGEECSIYGSNYDCNSAYIPASDSAECCPVGNCEISSCGQCTDCDNIFFPCSESQCHGVCETNQGSACYFVGDLPFQENCVPLDCSGLGLNQCSDYSEQECPNDPCSVTTSTGCEWTGSACQNEVSYPIPHLIRIMQGSATPNQEITVELEANSDGNEFVLLIEETVPPGWTVISSVPSEFMETVDPRILRTYHASELVALPSPFTVSYVIRAPSSTGTYDFDGFYVFDSQIAVVPTVTQDNGICETSTDKTQSEADPDNPWYYPQDCIHPTFGPTQVTVA